MEAVLVEEREAELAEWEGTAGTGAGTVAEVRRRLCSTLNSR